MFERFTNRARHVVVLAQEEARRLNHNYIGTEHILLGLLGEPEGVGARVLATFGISLDGAREEVVAFVGTGDKTLSGHIPFTPRAKKTLELALREALALHHNYIGTEHILLGVIREGKGVGAQVLSQHGDLASIRTAVLSMVGTGEGGQRARWLRKHIPGPAGSGAPAEQSLLSATPAADTTLSEAARLAGTEPVGSHHLVLAALTDADTAAARVLAALGVDLNRARDALRAVDVTGTSDELVEEAGRRQMVIRVAPDRLTIEATDPVIVAAGQAALGALGEAADPAGTIRGDLPASASLSKVWQALHDSLGVIKARATIPAESNPDDPPPDQPAGEAA